MSNTKVDGNILNVGSRPAQNPGNFMVFVDNNPLYNGEATETPLEPADFLYEFYINGSIDISFNGSQNAPINGHHWHLLEGRPEVPRGAYKLQITGGYTTSLKFITSDGVRTAWLDMTVNGYKKRHEFDVNVEFPVPA